MSKKTKKKEKMAESVLRKVCGAGYSIRTICTDDGAEAWFAIGAGRNGKESVVFRAETLEALCRSVNGE